MKQLIILAATLILGFAIASFIIGEDGIFSSMKELWRHELMLRNVHTVQQ